MGAEDEDLSGFKATTRVGSFKPDQWTPADYSRAKELTKRPFSNPVKGDQLLQAVEYYETTNAPHPSFIDYDPENPNIELPSGQPETQAATGSATTRVQALVPENIRRSNAQASRAAAGAGPLAAKAQQIFSAPERTFQGLREAAEDVPVSAASAATFDHADDIIANWDPERAKQIRADVTGARDRSPASTFVGDALAQAPAAAAATAMGAGPATLGALGGGINAHGRSEQTGFDTLPETAFGTAVGGATGYVLGNAPAAAKAVGGKFDELAGKLSTQRDRYTLRMGGITPEEIERMTPEAIKSYAGAMRNMGLTKGLPSVRTVGERANTAAQEYANKTDAVLSSLGDDAVVPLRDVQSRVRQIKGQFAEGGPTSQPYRDALEKNAQGYANMPTRKQRLAYHATPTENMDQVAKEGLQPREGGKNYALGKNKGRTYFGVDTPEKPVADSMTGWLDEVSATQGGTPMTLTRTTAPVQGVKGANAGIAIRTEPTGVNEVEFYDEALGKWRPLAQYGKGETRSRSALQLHESPAPDWFDEGRVYDDDQGMRLLAADNPSGNAPAKVGAADIEPGRGTVYGTAYDAEPKLPPPGQRADMDLGRDTVYATAYDAEPKLGAGGPGGALATSEPEFDALARSGPIPAQAIPRADIEPYLEGIPIRELNKEREVLGRKIGRSFAQPDPTLPAELQQDVYAALNSTIRNRAGQIQPGADEALRSNMWNQHTGIKVARAAQKQLGREAGKGLVRPDDIGAGVIGGMTAFATGNPALAPAAMVGNRLMQGRGPAVATAIAGGMQRGAGTVGTNANALGRALEDYMGAPSAAIASRAGTGAGGLVGASAQESEQQQVKAANNEGKGYKLGDTVEQLLATNPAALGGYAKRLGEAKQRGSAYLSAELEKLSKTDPLFQRKVLRELQAATK